MKSTPSTMEKVPALRRTSRDLMSGMVVDTSGDGAGEESGCYRMRVGSIGAVEPGSEQSRVDAWRQLVDARHATLVEAAAGVVAEGVTPASVMRLRRRFPDGPVTEALELAEARARAIEGVKLLWLCRPGGL